MVVDEIYYLKALNLVREDGLLLQIINTELQTSEICLEAIKENSVALQYVENPTPVKLYIKLYVFYIMQKIENNMIRNSKEK